MELLVSVRDVAEAVTAINQRVAVVDVKNPSRGSLGPANPMVARQVCAMARGRSALSLAMGEVIHYQPGDLGHLAGYSWAKAGLSEVDGRHMHRWLAWANDVSNWCHPVMVAYADWERCDAPDPRWLAALCVEWGVQAYLIDTFYKDGKGLLDWVELEFLEDLSSALRAAGIVVALAGSLDVEAIRKLATLPANLVAVRGAVCRAGDRTEPLDPSRIETLVEILRNESTFADTASR